jgi:hypothetical protein
MMIRFLLGLLIVFGAVGGMENPEAPLLPLVGLAIVGLFLMYFGSNKLKGQ